MLLMYRDYKDLLSLYCKKKVGIAIGFHVGLVYEL